MFRQRKLPLAALPVLVGAGLLANPAAQGQTAQALATRSLAASCAGCHGTDGQPAQGSAIPGLAGLPRDYLAAQMLAFKEGTRPATVMQQLAKGYSAEQIDALATYFSTRR